MVVKQNISREQALALVKQFNTDRSDLNHYLESEAVMRFLARKLDEDEDTYGLLGLVHDIDWGLTKENVTDHLTKAPKMLADAGFSDDFIQVIVSHGYGFDCAGLLDKKRTQKDEFALACSETITGLIHSYALMRKTMDGMDAKGLAKKFKDKNFAAGVDRAIIDECQNLGLTREEFFAIAIEAIRSIKTEVGLN